MKNYSLNTPSVSRVLAVGPFPKLLHASSTIAPHVLMMFLSSAGRPTVVQTNILIRSMGPISELDMVSTRQLNQTLPGKTADQSTLTASARIEFMLLEGMVACFPLIQHGPLRKQMGGGRELLP